MRPEVSVIIPAFNRAGMIGRALLSLQLQTLRDIEIVVVDDGSTDATVDVVRMISDARVRVIELPRNRGIPTARNAGLLEARGRYIAWLDSDDTARQQRLALQFAFLEAHPDIALIGSAAGRIRMSRNGTLSPRRPPRNHEEIEAKLLFRSAFQQSSIMGRAEILRQYPYRTEFSVCEDLDMFIRLTRDHRTANLPDVLIDRYLHSNQTVHREAPRIVEKKKVLFRESLARLGIEPRDDELEKHIVLGNIKGATVDRHFLDWTEDWLARIVAANEQACIYDEAALSAVTKGVWLKALGKTGPQQIARYYLGQVPSKIAARRRSIKSSRRWLADDRNISHAPDRRGHGKWIAQSAAALLFVTLGWVGRGQTDARLGSVPPIVAEADEARDMIAAGAPMNSPKVSDYRRLAQANGLPTVAMPIGWRVTSSGVVSTEHGPMLQVSALTQDGVAVTIIASNDSRGTSHVPVMRTGNDESIASWSRGSSGFAVAAQTSPERLHRAALELYDSGVVS